MRLTNRKSPLLLFLCLLLAAGVAGVVMARRQVQEKLPKVISKVKYLEVVGVSVRRDGEPTAALAIEIRNKSDKPVVAFSLESGDDQNASGIDINGDTGDDPPTTVIEPQGTRTVELPLSDIRENNLVKVRGAIFADGSEEGDAVALKSMHEHQKSDKAKTAKRKGGSN
ncbi:MAG: hypothetical protein ACJ74Q_03495 [Pyrinomonadaceae bacterium]